MNELGCLLTLNMTGLHEGSRLLGLDDGWQQQLCCPRLPCPIQIHREQYGRFIHTDAYNIQAQRSCADLRQGMQRHVQI